MPPPQPGQTCSTPLSPGVWLDRSGERVTPLNLVGAQPDVPGGPTRSLEAPPSERQVVFTCQRLVG